MSKKNAAAVAVATTPAVAAEPAPGICPECKGTSSRGNIPCGVCEPVVRAREEKASKRSKAKNRQAPAAAPKAVPAPVAPVIPSKQRSAAVTVEREDLRRGINTLARLGVGAAGSEAERAVGVRVNQGTQLQLVARVGPAFAKLTLKGQGKAGLDSTADVVEWAALRDALKLLLNGGKPTDLVHFQAVEGGLSLGVEGMPVRKVVPLVKAPMPAQFIAEPQCLTVVVDSAKLEAALDWALDAGGDAVHFRDQVLYGTGAGHTFATVLPIGCPRGTGLSLPRPAAEAFSFAQDAYNLDPEHKVRVAYSGKDEAGRFYFQRSDESAALCLEYRAGAAVPLLTSPREPTGATWSVSFNVEAMLAVLEAAQKKGLEAVVVANDLQSLDVLTANGAGTIGAVVCTRLAGTKADPFAVRLPVQAFLDGLSGFPEDDCGLAIMGEDEPVVLWQHGNLLRKTVLTQAKDAAVLGTVRAAQAKRQAQEIERVRRELEAKRKAEAPAEPAPKAPAKGKGKASAKAPAPAAEPVMVDVTQEVLRKVERVAAAAEAPKGRKAVAAPAPAGKVAKAAPLPKVEGVPAATMKRALRKAAKEVDPERVVARHEK
jgi:hypothetical protein